MSAAVVIRNGRLIDPRRREVATRDVLIFDGLIEEVGTPGLAAPDDATVIEAADRLLIPGLVNGHTHGHGNLQRNPGDIWTRELLLNAGPPDYGHQRLDDKYLSAKLGAAEMVSKGCTACYDLFYEFPVPSVEGLLSIGRGSADVGMRAVIAPMLADRTFYQAVPGLIEALPEPYRSKAQQAQATPWQTLLKIVKEALNVWPFDRDQIRLAVGPTIPMHCSDDFLVGAADFAREAGIGLHTHLAESKVQAVYGKEMYGRTLTAHLDGLGVLGPHFTAAHGVWLDDDDARRLADNGVSVSHNPGSNFRLGNGIAAVRRLLDAGVTVGVGTDSRHCSDNLNMFEAMRLASFASRVQGSDHTRWLTTDEVLIMATEMSAKALGFSDRMGRIEAGRFADIVFLDAANLNYVPLNDPVNQVVNAEDGTGVAAVMVGGRMVYEGGGWRGFDKDELRNQADAASERLLAANADARAFATRLEPVVASFCGGLAHRPYHVDRYGGGDVA